MGRRKVNRYTRAKKNGTIIYCPLCNDANTVYNFGWSAVICLGCKAEVKKNDHYLEPQCVHPFINVVEAVEAKK
jgi:ribosomal protein S27E